jgi:hypothetical protein
MAMTKKNGKGKSAGKGAAGRAKALEKVPAKAKAYGLRGTKPARGR